MNQRPVVFVASSNLWHGLMRVPKLLKSAGTDVVLMCRPDSVVAASKYVDTVIEVDGDLGRFCDVLVDHLVKNRSRYAWSMVLDEDVVREVHKYANSRIDLWYPFTRDDATLAFISSKLSFMQECSHLGIPVPDFRICNSLEDVDAGARSLGFPLVAKAALGAGGSGVRVVHNESQLNDAFAHIGLPLALQTYIAGQPFSTEVLYDRGTPVCWSSSEQMNRWPLELGSITAKRMIDTPEIESALIALGQRTQFHGIACVDAIKPYDGSRIVFCEMNPMPGVEAMADHRVLSTFATAIARILRDEMPNPRTPMPTDKHIVGLFPESFYFLSSKPQSLSRWALALGSLKYAPCEDLPLFLRLCADLAAGMLPNMGMRRAITAFFMRFKTQSSTPEPAIQHIARSPLTSGQGH